MGNTAVLLIRLFGMFVPSYQCCPHTFLTVLVYILCWSFLHDKLKLMSTQFSSNAICLINIDLMYHT